jgi:toxin ParE1/3/4
VIEVRLPPEAEVDLAAAATLYDRLVAGLGERFVAAVELALNRIGQNPHVGAELQDGIRKVRVSRFPYNLIYRVLPTEVLISAVAHHRRRPHFWQTRK